MNHVSDVAVHHRGSLRPPRPAPPLPVLRSTKILDQLRERIPHADVATTMIYTHVVKLGGGAVRTPDRRDEFDLTSERLPTAMGCSIPAGRDRQIMAGSTSIFGRQTLIAAVLPRRRLAELGPRLPGRDSSTFGGGDGGRRVNSQQQG